MRIRSGFILSKVSTTYAVLAVGKRAKRFNSVITLNETGAFIWRALEKEITKEQLFEDFCKEYAFTTEEDREMARRDLDEFLDEVRKNNLLLE